MISNEAQEQSKKPFLLKECPIQNKRNQYLEHERYIAFVSRQIPCPCFSSFQEAIAFCRGALRTNEGKRTLTTIVIDSDPCNYKAYHITKSSSTNISIDQDNLDYNLYHGYSAEYYRIRQKEREKLRRTLEKNNEEVQRIFIIWGVIIFLVVVLYKLFN